MSRSEASHPVPLLLLGESRRRRLVERLGAIVNDWHAAWRSAGVPAPVVELPVAAVAGPITAARQSVALAALDDGELLLGVETDADFVKALCVAHGREKLSLSFASPRGKLEEAMTAEAVGALLTNVVRAALPSVACELRKSAALAQEEAGPAWHRRAFHVRITAGPTEAARTLELDVAPRVAEALLGERPVVSLPEALSSRRQAMQAEQLTVTVSLGSASVSWRDLNGLSIGDAIVLDQDLSAPCTLAVGRSKPIAEAHLGRIDDVLAVQVARIHPQERRERR